MPNPSYRLALTAAALLGGLSFTGASIAADLPPGEGRDAVQAACTSCHGVDIFVSRRSPEEWTEVVGRMIGNGAILTDDQYAAVMKYLSTTLAPGAAAPAAQAPPPPPHPASH